MFNLINVNLITINWYLKLQTQNCISEDYNQIECLKYKLTVLLSYDINLKLGQKQKHIICM